VDLGCAMTSKRHSVTLPVIAMQEITTLVPQVINGTPGIDLLAYIDPNSGGLLFQILFPILVTLIGLFVSFRRFLTKTWKRIRKDKEHDGRNE
jgi:hypothetical protein